MSHIKRKFCSICENLLIPSEETGKLIFKCSICEQPNEDYSQSSYISVYKNELQITANKLFIPSYLAKELIADPTYFREKKFCENCQNTEVHVVVGEEKESKDVGIEVVYVCEQCAETSTLTEPAKAAHRNAEFKTEEEADDEEGDEFDEEEFFGGNDDEDEDENATQKIF